MQAELWKKVDELYHAALAEAPEKRAEFLARACPDAQVRAEVQSLLEQAGGSFLDTSPLPSVVRPGAKLGNFQLLERVGRGGMGEVWRARDSRLKRDVAIKVLPPHLSTTPHFRLRFKREAEAISALNHAHICTLHDIGHENGIDYLVMEYLEGEPLSERLARGPLRINETLRYAIEIADALAAAHRKGILHRDLKPGNIMLTRSGAKLLDFGLAKVATHQEGDSETSDTGLTGAGTLLGTLPYMSPEQVQGRSLDPRSDVFSFGAVLYEMCTGRRAFAAENRVQVIAAILDRAPEPAATVDPAVPPALDRLIGFCLTKDPEDRLQNMRDASENLRWIQAAAHDRVHARNRRAWLSAVAGAAVMAAISIVVAMVWRSGNSTAHQSEILRSILQPPPGVDAINVFRPNVAISPDGKSIAVAAPDGNGRYSLWVQSLHSTDFRRLNDTEDAASPFWSPESTDIGFFTRNQLKRISAAGSISQVLAQAEDSQGGSWGSEGVILFSAKGAIWRTDPRGAAATLVAKTSDARLIYPQLLPGLQKYLVTRWIPGAVGDAYIASLTSGERSLLLKGAPRPLYSLEGYVLFLRGRALVARTFDPSRGSVGTDELTIADNVGFTSGRTNTLSVSEVGSLAYYDLPPVQQARPVWFRRAGERSEAPLAAGPYRQLAISPDGTYVALEISQPWFGRGPDPNGILLLNLKNGATSVLCSGLDLYEGCSDPVWFSDSRHVLYSVNHPGWDSRRNAIYERSVELEEPKLIFTAAPHRFIWTSDISPDSKVAAILDGGDVKTLYSFQDAALRKLPLDNTTDQMRFSPDGRWLAFDSAEGGRWEVYLARLPELTAKRQVSVNGGAQPVWRRDGKELFYLSLDGRMMSTPVAANGNEPDATSPRVLFQTTLSARDVDATVNQYDVTGDRRFLILEPTTPTSRQPIHLIQNWTAALRK
ncbi:MAG TPA: protein kinase [Bryobacteraceae bacterium]|nr:protein kinase [Bryobacteraceae bacterium]